MKKNIFFILVLICTAVGSSFLTSHLPTKEIAENIDRVMQPQEPAQEVEQIAETETQGLYKIPVLEYHNFGDEEQRWTRTYDNFYNDLLWLYNNDYRPVTVAQYLNMEFPIEAGKKPVVITFDDASVHQFSYLEDGTIDPKSAIGVMNRFSEEHPDFGTAGTFFVLPYSFGQADTVSAKLNYLVRTGREIGNHTFDHESLDKLGSTDIQKELAQQEAYVQEQLDQPYSITALAYPSGLYPEGPLFDYIKHGEYDGHAYTINAAFLVGAAPALMPDNPDFDPYKLPRIQAINDEWKRWFNREPGETGKSDKNPNFTPYIADSAHALGVQKLPVIETVQSDTPAEVSTETAQPEVQPEEPKLPYELCKPSDFTPSPYGEVFWKWIKNKSHIIAVNQIPTDITYKDGNFYYTVTGEEGSLSEKFFAYSNQYRISTFKQHLIDANPDKNFEAGDEIVVPDIPKFLVTRQVNDKNLWGIYLTGYSATSDEGSRIIDELKKQGGRLVVFDVKEIDGDVFYPSKVAMVAETGADGHVIIPNLNNYVRYWHDKGVYLAARMVVFKDINLTGARPDLAIHNKAGGVWSSSEGPVWLDPSNQETQNYIMDLAEELAQAGVDEIQFDYIRFPTQGTVNDTKYNFDEATTEKYEVIRNFIARVHDRLRPYDAKLSLDVYGVIAWNGGYDSISTGQKMECLGPYIDVVYPMVYPSHFGPGFAGYANPADAPYYFVSESIKLFQHFLEGTDTKIRPWLQAFSWRVSNYGWWYVDEQVKAANDEGIYEYSLWNASNNYFY